MLLFGYQCYWLALQSTGRIRHINAIFHWKSPSEKCLFAQKLGPNLSKMEVRTFLSIKKVIWDQLSRRTLFLTCTWCRARREKVEQKNKLSALRTVSVCFCVVLFCSPSRSFFRLNHVRKVRKRCFHSIFSSPAIILAFFLTETFPCAQGTRTRNQRWK